MRKELLECLFLFMREMVKSWSEAVVQGVVDQVADGPRVDISEGLHVGGEAGPGEVRPEDVGGGGERGGMGPAQLWDHQTSPPVRVLPALYNVRCQVVTEVDRLPAPAPQHLHHTSLSNRMSAKKTTEKDSRNAKKS